MSVLYHPGKANVVADSLSRMIMGCVSHVDEAKKNYGKMFIRWLVWVLHLKILQMGVI